MSMQGEKIYNLSKEIVHLESQVHEAIADKRKLMDDFKKQDDQLKAMALQSYDDNFKIIRFRLRSE